MAKLREEERLKMEAQLESQISKAQDLKKLQQEQKRTEFLEIQRFKEQERGISEQAYRLLEEGTELKNNKKYDEAFQKAREIAADFPKNNDLIAHINEIGENLINSQIQDVIQHSLTDVENSISNFNTTQCYIWYPTCFMVLFPSIVGEFG